MIVYQVCGIDWANQLFKTLREAKAYVSENDIKDYYIQKSKMTKPTADAMIAIINSEGGSWCEEDYGIIETAGMWKEKDAFPPGLRPTLDAD